MFVFPDNGVITFVAERMPLERIVAVHNTKILTPGAISRTFHGRDVFAPLAAQLLNGLDMGRLGPEPGTYKLLDIPTAEQRGKEIVGQVINVDRFGNLISNIPEQMIRKLFGSFDGLRVICAGRDVGEFQETYAMAGQGEPLALINSRGYVEVAVNRGSAKEVLSADVGAEVKVVETRSK